MLFDYIKIIICNKKPRRNTSQWLTSCGKTNKEGKAECEELTTRAKKMRAFLTAFLDAKTLIKSVTQCSWMIENGYKNVTIVFKIGFTRK